MLRTHLASSRVLRVCVIGLVAITSAVIFTTNAADARYYRHRHYAYHRHSEAQESYSPAFASIIVGWGAWAFGAVVVLTLLAARTFDERLLWDTPRHN